MKLLITGATGKLGTKIVDHLLRRINADDLVVSVRNVEKAEDLKARGVEVRHGDFDLPKTLATAFAGIDRLLIISTDGEETTRIRQHTAAIEAAQAAGIGLIAYTSIANAQASQNFLARTHQVTERLIEQTGIPYVFFRNNWYLENEMATIDAVRDGADWLTAAGDGKVGWALQDDYAEAIATVLTTDEPKAIYELSGPLLTQTEIAQALGAVLARPVAVQQVDLAMYADIMKQAGLPDFLIPMLISIQEGIAQDTLAVESQDFEQILGRPPVAISDALERLLKR
ncbi:SDR family oxidoreductase [Exiguobacterium oxidotolerans]|uniref:NAD(P)-dependent oxidoreductase n=1 Tax=Exiguobacterium oxidotolerans TaxID=223958 RepID=A0A653II07_9BACL|nr:SDR family oxidoreductase [Exiguobacterium oxidotolerans]VWX38401.1 NAD(P)-dependent oxidoreductase [Exiguobacterium oxidotolerans]